MGAGVGPHAVRVWDSATRKELLQFTDNPTLSRLLAISPDKRTLVHGIGRCAGAGNAGEDRLFFRDLTRGKNESLDASVKGEKGFDEWLQKNRFPRVKTGNTIGPYCLAFSPDSKHLATGGWFGVTIWDVGYFHQSR